MASGVSFELDPKHFPSRLVGPVAAGLDSGLRSERAMSKDGPHRDNGRRKDDQDFEPR